MIPNTTTALPLARLPHILREEERRDIPTTSVSATLETPLAELFEEKNRQCVNARCGASFVGRAPGLCDACHAQMLETELRTGKGSFHSSFPPRAVKDTASMRGPALSKARALLPRLRSGGAIIIVIGDRWTGKTVLATYLAGMLRSGRYVKACDLFRRLRSTFSKDSALREWDVLKPYVETDFLVIDEVQERKKDSEFEMVTLTNLIDKRYDAMRRTLLIANLKEDALNEYLGASIISRAERSGGGIVVCDWPSYGEI